MSVVLYPGKGLTRRTRLAAGLGLVLPVIIITDFLTGNPQVKWGFITSDAGWAAVLAEAGWDVALSGEGWVIGEPEPMVDS